ncbi:hypothetical protein AUI06_09700 [archaeon 13_2_20CM_2_52_21]|nr:MAG: hypothetical protein AUI06_09700 [archaeon 13_2_20CM_2_52_21]
MRPVIFFVGIGMVILGPLVTLSAFSSCLGTILSGNISACVTDIVYFVLGGIMFVAGVITAIIGVFVPDPIPAASTGSLGRSIPQQSGVQVICKKCGHGYDSGLFFCPSCGQRQG